MREPPIFFHLIVHRMRLYICCTLRIHWSSVLFVWRAAFGWSWGALGPLLGCSLGLGAHQHKFLIPHTFELNLVLSGPYLLVNRLHPLLEFLSTVLLSPQMRVCELWHNEDACRYWYLRLALYQCKAVLSIGISVLEVKQILNLTTKYQEWPTTGSVVH